MISLSTILSYFKRGLYPTEEQFDNTFLSFWHKSEKIPQDSIFGLQESLSQALLGLTYQAPVAAIADLETTYPSPIKGWAAMVTEVGYIYSFNGIAWANTGLKAFPQDVLTLANNNAVNLDVLYPLALGSFYSLISALSVLENKYKKRGLNISFAISEGVTVRYGYKPSSLTGWATVSNWEVLEVLGIFGNIAVASNLNTIDRTGPYTCYGTAIGAPNTANSWFIEHFNSGVGTVSAYQVARSFVDGTTYTRNKVANVWGSWIIIYSSAFSVNGYITLAGTLYAPDSARKSTNLTVLDITKNIELVAETNNPLVLYLSYFDDMGNFISGLSNTETNNSTVVIVPFASFPVNAVYYRSCCLTADLYKSYVKNSDTSSLLALVRKKTDAEDGYTSGAIDSCVRKAQSRNLFNPNDTDVINYVFIDVAGDYSNNSKYFTTGFIPINKSSVTVNKSSSGGFWGFYDKKKVKVPGSFSSAVVGSTKSFVENAVYARWSGPIASKETLQIEYGAVVTEYQAYDTVAKKSDLIPISDEISNIDSNSVKLEIGLNLLDENAEDGLEGKYLYNAGGIGTSSAYDLSGYMPVKPDTTYTGIGIGAGGAYNCCYAANKLFIASFQGNTYTTPSNAAYIRCSYYKINKGIVMFYEGLEAYSYEAYGKFLPIENIPNSVIKGSDNAEIVLPNTLYFLKDTQLNIYYANTIFKSFRRDLNARFSGVTNARNYERQYSGTPTSVISNGSFITNLYSSQLIKFFTKTLNFSVIDSVENVGKFVKILTVGDSFTNMGSYMRVVNDLLISQGVTPTWIGTMGNGTDSVFSENQSGGTLAHSYLVSRIDSTFEIAVTGIVLPIATGYANCTYSDSNGVVWTILGTRLDENGDGWLRVYKYNTAGLTIPASGILTRVTGTADVTITYSNAVSVNCNPFWNTVSNSLDFSYYISNYGFGYPDILLLQFTWNDIGTWATDSSIATVVAGVKTFVDKFHVDFPVSKVIFSIEPMGALSPSDNLDNDGKLYSVLKFAKLMFSTFDNVGDYTYMRVAPSYAWVDRVNGYPRTATALCSRYPTVLDNITSSDATHCNGAGMSQIADCIVPIIHSLL